MSSYSIHDVIDLDNLEFDPEGFNNYLDFGYSVFGLTPVKHVRFLEPNQEIDENGQVRDLDDPIHDHLSSTTPECVIECVRDRLAEFERDASGPVVLPLSGGYDSRFLASLFPRKDRLLAYTYGVSSRQSESFEVQTAKEAARVLGIRWEQIVLGDFHVHLDDWDSLYGVATHAHYMYGWEFFKLIRSRTDAQPLLSGIVGDAWTGKVQTHAITSMDDLHYLGLTHGIHADSSYSKLPMEHAARRIYWDRKKEYLKDPRLQILELIRMKMVLLSCLFRVPERFGFAPYSPFVDPEVVGKMLSLGEARKGRAWQAEYFREQGLDLASRGTMQNSLNRLIIENSPPPILDEQLLSQLVEPEYVRWINRTLQTRSRWRRMRSGVLSNYWIGGVLRRGLGYLDPSLKAYFAYLTLRPIENLIRRSPRYSS
jgi:hypothetical protein